MGANIEIPSGPLFPDREPGPLRRCLGSMLRPKGPRWGAVVFDDASQGEVILATVDLAEIRWRRANWGVLRDRRPDLYGPLLTLDGGTPEW